MKWFAGDCAISEFALKFSVTGKKNPLRFAGQRGKLAINIIVSDSLYGLQGYAAPQVMGLKVARPGNMDSDRPEMQFKMPPG
ncbi:MAG: hypothetical protein ACRCWW_00390 [Scandinavium sp.]|uniref:hypothetical protein n=1 Tax=Scandinavium sp. TaxID=2830653 RepID=UPI003F3D905C